MAKRPIFVFNGQTYNIKGRLCHAIVKRFVEQNPKATLITLQKAFNTNVRMFVATPEMASTIKDSSGKAGGDYYMNEEDRIGISGGEVVVWKYWPEKYFNPFMECVKALGFDITMKEADEADDEGASVTGMKNLNLFIGGGYCYYFDLTDPREGVLDSLKSEDNGSHCEIECYFDGNIDYVLKYNAVSCKSGLDLSVKDNNGEIVFEDKISRFPMFNGDAEKWKFADNVDKDAVSAFLSHVEELKKDGEYDEDELNELVGNYFGVRADIKKVFKANGSYTSNKWFLMKWGRLSPLYDDDETERPADEIYFGHDYGVGYCGTIEIPANEEFDVQKLQFLIDDYDDLIPSGDCIDCITPFVKYDNKIYQLHIISSYWSRQWYALAQMNPSYGCMDFKNYDDFLEE